MSIIVGSNETDDWRDMTTITKRLLLLSFLAAIGSVLCAGCSSDDSGDKSNARTVDLEPNDSLVIELAGRDSMTVLEVTDAAHDVQCRASAMGSFVIQIDTIRNSPRYFWVCSVNGEMIDVAADKHMTRTGDVVRWHYRRFGR